MVAEMESSVFQSQMHSSPLSAQGTTGTDAVISLLTLHTLLPFSSDPAFSSRLGTTPPSHRTRTVSARRRCTIRVGSKTMRCGHRAALSPCPPCPWEERWPAATQLRPGKGSAPLSLPPCLRPGSTHKLPQDRQWMLRSAFT